MTVEIGTPAPTPTPAVCTPLPAHMTLRIIPLSATSFNLELTGLQENEELIIIVRGEAATESAEITWHRINDRVVDGRASERITLGLYDDIQYWQGKVIHALGVACFEFSLPLPSDEIDAPPEPPPQSAPYAAIKPSGSPRGAPSGAATFTAWNWIG